MIEEFLYCPPVSMYNFGQKWRHFGKWFQEGLHAYMYDLSLQLFLLCYHGNNEDYLTIYFIAII